MRAGATEIEDSECSGRFKSLPPLSTSRKTGSVVCTNGCSKTLQPSLLFSMYTISPVKAPPYKGTPNCSTTLLSVLPHELYKSQRRAVSLLCSHSAMQATDVFNFITAEEVYPGKMALTSPIAASCSPAALDGSLMRKLLVSTTHWAEARAQDRTSTHNTTAGLDAEGSMARPLVDGEHWLSIPPSCNHQV